MMRPTREDNPDFTGSNPLSVPSNLPASGLTVGHGANLNIAIPYWEAVGPWDVDNDNDGVPDSVWVDLGDPIQEAEDGTRYKPLYAFLIVDLDSRLNVNAHGLADDVVPPTLDPLGAKLTRADFFDSTRAGNLAHDTSIVNPPPSLVRSTLQLPRGIGYGPAEISLRSVFPAPLDVTLSPRYGNRSESAGPVDDYAAVLNGRLPVDGTAVSGRFGFDPNVSYPATSSGDAAMAGTNYRYLTIPNNEPANSPRQFTGEQATPSLLAQLKFFDYPWSFWNAATGSTQRNYQSAFGTPPDLKARYALGLDYMGQPVYEVATDVNPTAMAQQNQQLPFNLLAKSPYELDLSSTQRRDEWATSTNSLIADSASAFNQSLIQNDDAAFSTSDLEKVLRAWDADAGTLPSRLWDCVNAFDPAKLVNQQYGDLYRVQQKAQAEFGSTSTPELLTAAQQLAGVNRRLVTTDSVEVPVAGGNVPNQAALAVGPDGKPGRALQDDDPDGSGPLTASGGQDDASEIGAPGSDDFKAIIGKDPAKATIVDLLQYRVWTEARRYEMRRQSLTEGDVANLSTGNNGGFAKFMTAVNARATRGGRESAIGFRSTCTGSHRGEPDGSQSAVRRWKGQSAPSYGHHGRRG